MTGRCEPPPELRGVDGWHWVRAVGPVVSSNTIIMRWGARAQGWWHEEVGMRGHNAEEAAEDGWRYLYPALPPAEIAALRAENARLREALEEIAKPLDARDLPALRGEPVSWRREVARAALAKEPTP